MCLSRRELLPSQTYKWEVLVIIGGHLPTAHGFGGSSFAIAQNTDGPTTVNTSNSKPLGWLVNGIQRAYCTKQTAFNIEKLSGKSRTHFSLNDAGNNYIRSNESTTFHFNSANSGATVITKGEVTIEGVAVKAKLTALENRIKALEQKKYLLSGNPVYLKNRNNNKHLSKASSNEDALVNRTSKVSRSRFWIDKA